MGEQQDERLNGGDGHGEEGVIAEEIAVALHNAVLRASYLVMVKRTEKGMDQAKAHSNEGESWVYLGDVGMLEGAVDSIVAGNEGGACR